MFLSDCFLCWIEMNKWEKHAFKWKVLIFNLCFNIVFTYVSDNRLCAWTFFRTFLHSVNCDMFYLHRKRIWLQTIQHSPYDALMRMKMVTIFLWHFFRFLFFCNYIMPHMNMLSVTDCRKNYENVFIWAHIKTIFHRNFCGYVSHWVKCSHMNRKWIAHFISLLSFHTIRFAFMRICRFMQRIQTNVSEWANKRLFPVVTTIDLTFRMAVEKEKSKKEIFVCFILIYFSCFLFPK